MRRRIYFRISSLSSLSYRMWSCLTSLDRSAGSHIIGADTDKPFLNWIDFEQISLTSYWWSVDMQSSEIIILLD